MAVIGHQSTAIGFAASAGSKVDDAAKIAAANSDPRPWPMQWIDDGIAVHKETLTREKGSLFWKKHEEFTVDQKVHLAPFSKSHGQRLEAAGIETVEIPEALRGHLFLIKGDENTAKAAAQVLSSTDKHARPTAVVLEDLNVAGDANKFYVGLPATEKRYSGVSSSGYMREESAPWNFGHALDTRKPMIPDASARIERSHPGLVGLETEGRYSNAIRSGTQFIAAAKS